MRKIKILQLACYQGNIGDNANITGTRALLNQNLPFKIEYTDMDIMDYIWRFRKFDAEFAMIANQHDLMLIGGGGYFELTSDQSCTGTPLDISIDVLEQIKVPTVFYALGVDTGRGINRGRIDKFRNFLDNIFSSDNRLVSVRNDGAKDTVRKLLGDEYAKRIYQVPDGGFFTVVSDHYHPELPENNRVIGINLAGDMPDIRFLNNSHSLTRLAKWLSGSRTKKGGQITRNISTTKFLAGLAALITRYLSEHDDLSIVLIPHIYKDLNVISEFMAKIPSHVNRRRITVAPYLHGYGAQDYIFDLYRKCDLIMGMRFHANVCSIGLNVPTIGLITYPQIEQLYRILGLSESALRVNEAGFEKKLLELIEESLSNRDNTLKKLALIRENLLNEVKAFHDVIKSLLVEQEARSTK